MQDQLPRDLRIEIKKEYLQIIKNMEYKVTYDMDAEVDDPLYDLNLLVTRVRDPLDGFDDYTKKRYIPYCIGFTSALGFDNFRKVFHRKDRDGQAAFVKGIQNRMMEYSLDDVAAVLLSEGMHLPEFYKFKDGKGRLYLNRAIVGKLLQSLNLKGSPLESQFIRNKRVAERQK